MHLNLVEEERGPSLRREIWFLPCLIGGSQFPGKENRISSQLIFIQIQRKRELFPSSVLEKLKYFYIC